MPRILFFATRDDILAILEPIEQKRGLVYYPYGRYPESSIPMYASAAQIPNLGVSPTGMDDSDTRYLILPVTTPLILRTNEYVPNLMFVDHDCNPAAVVLIPGGCYGDQCLILGTFIAGRQDADALQLLKLFRIRLRHEFVRIEDCYVGPVAYQMLRSGKRLTDSVRSSPDRDLRLPKGTDCE